MGGSTPDPGGCSGFRTALQTSFSSSMFWRMPRILSRALIAALLLAAAGPASARSSVNRLLKELRAAKGDEQIRAIRALGRTGQSKAADALLPLLDIRKDSPKRSAALVEALGALRAKQALDPIIASWDYLDSMRLQMDLTAQLQVLRASVVEALGRIGGEGASKILIDVLDDADQGVVEKAVKGLGLLREKRAVEAIIALSTRGGNMAQTCYEVLGEIGDDRCLAPLEKGLLSENPMDRVPPAYGLARMGKKEGVRRLAAVVEESPPGDKAALLAAYYLARLDKKAGLDYLVQLIEAERGPMRIPAAEALGKSGNKRAVLPLVEALEGSEPDLRLAIALALGRLGGPRAVYALRNLQGDPSPGVRGAAGMALGELGEE